ncbi:MAG: putative ATP-dependent RNA helicase ddx6 [Paramarteilia canceri]
MPESRPELQEGGLDPSQPEVVSKQSNGTATKDKLTGDIQEITESVKKLKANSIQRTEDVKVVKSQTFQDIGISKNLAKAVFSALGWESPSPIQEKFIPEALTGQNIIARAKNGTGKTGSFILPVLEKIDKQDPSKVEALVLTTTRELAMQTSNLFISISRKLKSDDEISDINSQSHKQLDYPKTLLLHGGTPVHEQIAILKDHENQNIKICVGTCGRVYDLANRKILPFENIKYLVLDEADRLLSTYSLPVVNKIISLCPKNIQIMLLSATYPVQIQKTVTELVQNAKLINLMEELTLKGLTPYYCNVPEKKKIQLLNTLFSRLTLAQAVIFVSSSKRAMLLNKILSKIGYSTTFINSQMNQTTRKHIFNDFKANHYRIMICTDIFERGIDNPKINVVINFDTANSSQQYLHRVGRAGRYGRKAIAIDIVCDDERDHYLQIMSELSIKPSKVPEKFDESLYVNV